MQKTKRTVILSFLLCITMTLSAQRNEIFSSDIATLQVHNTQQLRAMLPVIQLRFHLIISGMNIIVSPTKSRTVKPIGRPLLTSSAATI